MAVRRRTWIIIAVAVAVLGLVIVATRVVRPSQQGPAQAVQTVLELRQGRSTDASAYAQYFTDTEITEALVREGSQASESTSSAVSPIPGWEPPYVSAQTTSSADVVVVWTPDRRFEKWTKATIFSLEETSGRWVIVNAVELTSSVPPKAGAQP